MTRRKFFQARTRNYNYIDDLTSMSYGEIEKTGHFIAFFKERSKYLDGTRTITIMTLIFLGLWQGGYIIS